MKRIICLLFSLIFILLFLVGCSREEKYNPEPLFARSFSALLEGELYGVPVDVCLEVREGVSEGREFFACFISGALEGIVVSRDSKGIRISSGGLEERSFYEGGLSLVCDLFCAEEYDLVRIDKATGTAIFSARARDIEFFMVAGEGGVPQHLESDGLFSLDVKEFSLIK